MLLVKMLLGYLSLDDIRHALTTYRALSCIALSAFRTWHHARLIDEAYQIADQDRDVGYAHRAVTVVLHDEPAAADRDIPRRACVAHA